MIITLFKNNLKKNWILLLIFFGVLTMYTSIIISIYSPKDMENLTTMINMFPEDLMSAMGFSEMVTDLTGYIASWLYGLLMFGFPMVYCIILGNRLVAKMVDNSSFAYLLSTPNSRNKIIITQGVYALFSLVILFTALFGVGSFIAAIMFPGNLDIGAYLSLNFTTMLVNMAVMMISFFFSCTFNETRVSLSFGAGIPIIFIIMNMLGNTTSNIKFLKKFSIYGFYDPVELVHGGNILGVNLIYICIIFILFIAGIFIFNKKRLPL